MPEFAQKYQTDYDGYCEAPRLYTRRYATRDRPDYKVLMFLNGERNSNNSGGMMYLTTIEQDVDSISAQQSVRGIYDG